MLPFFRIQGANISHVSVICEIERTALEMFRGHRIWPFYEAISIPPAVLVEQIQMGVVWVAVMEATDELVGFIWLDTELGDGVIGVAEMDVLPTFHQRGIGSALLEHACDWARASGYRRVDLGTLVDVPWNAPFYAKRGFVLVDKHDPAFAYALERDRSNGFPDALRVFMSRLL